MNRAIQDPVNSRFACVAVTGASGYVAGHLIDKLTACNIQVRAISRRSLRLPHAKNYSVNYFDADALRTALRGVDVVIHLAGRAHRADEERKHCSNYDVYFNSNVLPTQAIASAARAEAVRRIVFVSTVNVKETELDVGTDSEQFSDPAAASKLAGERVLQGMLREGPTDYVIVRLPMVYGPDCPGNFRKLLGLAYRLPIIPFGRIDQQRSFMGIRNLVDALLVASASGPASRQTFDLCDGVDLSVGDVFRELRLCFGKPSWTVINVSPKLISMIVRLAGMNTAWQKLNHVLRVDVSAFSTITGWAPPISPILEIRETAAHYLAAKTKRWSR